MCPYPCHSSIFDGNLYTSRSKSTWLSERLFEADRSVHNWPLLSKGERAGRCVDRINIRELWYASRFRPRVAAGAGKPDVSGCAISLMRTRHRAFNSLNLFTFGTREVYQPLPPHPFKSVLLIEACWHLGALEKTIRGRANWPLFWPTAPPLVVPSEYHGISRYAPH